MNMVYEFSYKLGDLMYTRENRKFIHNMNREQLILERKGVEVHLSEKEAIAAANKLLSDHKKACQKNFVKETYTEIVGGLLVPAYGQEN